MRQFLLRRKKLSSTIENILDISSAMRHPNYFDWLRTGAVENQVATERKAQNCRTKFLSAESRPWLMSQHLNRFMQVVNEGVQVRALQIYVARASACGGSSLQGQNLAG